MNVSVIIPTYKPQDYLWECLESLYNQTFSKNDFEVVLILNGCCEPYKSEIEKYLADNMSDMHVNFIQTDQPGVSNARNVGLDVAKGEYITFIDDDDYVSQVYLERLYEKAKYNVISASNTVAFKTSPEGKKCFLPIYSVQRHYNRRAKYGLQPYYKAECFSGPCMKLIHRDVIGSQRYNTLFKNHEDTLFLYEISRNFEKVDFTSADAIYYRNIRTGSATTSYPLKKRLPTCLRLAKEYTKIYFSDIKALKLRFYISHMIGVVKIIIAG